MQALDQLARFSPLPEVAQHLLAARPVPALVANPGLSDTAWTMLWERIHRAPGPFSLDIEMLAATAADRFDRRQLVLRWLPHGQPMVRARVSRILLEHRTRPWPDEHWRILSSVVQSRDAPAAKVLARDRATPRWARLSASAALSAETRLRLVLDDPAHPADDALAVALARAGDSAVSPSLLWILAVVAGLRPALARHLAVDAASLPALAALAALAALGPAAVRDAEMTTHFRQLARTVPVTTRVRHSTVLAVLADPELDRQAAATLATRTGLVDVWVRNRLGPPRRSGAHALTASLSNATGCILTARWALAGCPMPDGIGHACRAWWSQTDAAADGRRLGPAPTDAPVPDTRSRSRPRPCQVWVEPLVRTCGTDPDRWRLAVELLDGATDPSAVRAMVLAALA